MGLFGDVRQQVGTGVSRLGNSLGLPELGISETISPRSKMASWGAPKATQPHQPQASTGEPTYGGGGYSSGGGGAAAPANYDWMVDAQLGQLDNQANIGRSNIAGSYGSAFNSLLNSKTRAREDLDSTQNTTQQDNLLTRDRIGKSVRNNLTGLQRLLGARGAGASSASKVLAPYAAGLQGNQQLQDVSRTYGANMGTLDTTRKRTDEDFENKFGELNADRTNKERSLMSNIQQKRLQLLAQKGDPNARAQIEALTNEISGLGAVEAFQPRQVAYSRPDLAKYNFGGLEAGQASSQPGADNLGAFYNLLDSEKEKQLA